MRFSLLHISDLHRDLSDEVDNVALLDSLERDLERQCSQESSIPRPALCIVSGDLVYGVHPTAPDASRELARQYDQAVELLVGIADRFFSGKRVSVVLLPGNHDISFPDVMSGMSRIAVPADNLAKGRLVEELFSPRSNLRWSWSELCFFRIENPTLYHQRLRPFATAYQQFYEGRRTFPLDPEKQYQVFDFPELGLCVLALSSCHRNDPFRRAGAFHPAALTEAIRAVRATERTGWLVAAAWHHSFLGGPTADDYLDSEFLQLLLQAGVSLGFHGHQHRTDCVEERFRLGISRRRITVISAGTLCAGPHNLTPGVPRSFNVVEIDTDSWTGRVHHRQMANQQFTMPIWGPGHLNATNQSFLDFEIAPPPNARPAGLDEQLVVSRAERLVGERLWSAAAELLLPHKELPLARVMLARALDELKDNERLITVLWPPATAAEAVLVGGAIISTGNEHAAEEFLRLPIVASATDASVGEMARRVAARRGP